MDVQSSAVDDKVTTFEDVIQASKTLEGVAHRTKVVTSSYIDDQVTALSPEFKFAYNSAIKQGEMDAIPKIKTYFKCENFQKTGSFKFRGAYNAISKLSPAQKKKGVLAYSAGNHGQGVAFSGSIFKIRTQIIVPKDAP